MNEDIESTDSLSRLLVEFFEKFSSWEHAVVRDSGLSLSQTHTLEILGTHGPMRMKELAERMGLTTGTLTVTVDKLEQLGLVRRRPNEQDRRSILVELTAEGGRHFEVHDQLHASLTRDMLSELDSAERKTLRTCLEKMLRSF